MVLSRLNYNLEYAKPDFFNPGPNWFRKGLCTYDSMHRKCEGDSYTSTLELFFELSCCSRRTTAAAASMASSSRRRLRRGARRAALASCSAALIFVLGRPRTKSPASSRITMRKEALSTRGNVYKARTGRSTSGRIFPEPASLLPSGVRFRFSRSAFL